MGRFKHASLMLLAAALCLCASGSAHSAPTTSSIRGRVESSGQPLAGVTISAGGGYSTTTAGDGTFVLANLPAGTYTITPTISGVDGAFQPLSRTVTVPPDATDQDFVFYQLVIDYAIYGAVETPAGLPIEGVEIMVDGRTIGSTGSGGTFAFFASLNQTYLIEPRKPGYSFTPSSRSATVSNSPVDFIGQPSNSIYLPVIRSPCPSGICGGVRIENGGVCCIGGAPGTTVDIPVSFAAQSANGGISGMRTDNAGCTSQDAIATAWEPFATQQIYTRKLSPNWSTFAVRVQYQDVAGVVSKMYCAEVALEGF